MKKFKKGYRVKIALLVAVMFLLNSAVYGINLSNKTQLRVPIQPETYKRIEDEQKAQPEQTDQVLVARETTTGALVKKEYTADDWFKNKPQRSIHKLAMAPGTKASRIPAMYRVKVCFLSGGALAILNDDPSHRVAIYRPDQPPVFLTKASGVSFNKPSSSILGENWITDMAADEEGNIFVLTADQILRKYTSGGTYEWEKKIEVALGKRGSAILGISVVNKKLYVLVETNDEVSSYYHFNIIECYDLKDGSKKMIGYPFKSPLSVMGDLDHKIIFILSGGYYDKESLPENILGFSGRVDSTVKPFELGNSGALVKYGGTFVNEQVGPSGITITQGSKLDISTIATSGQRLGSGTAEKGYYVPAMIRTLNTSSNSLSEPRPIPDFLKFSNMAIDDKGRVFTVTGSEKLIHVWHPDKGYLGNLVIPEGKRLDSVSISREGHLAIGQPGQFILIHRDLIDSLIVKPKEKIPRIHLITSSAQRKSL